MTLRRVSDHDEEFDEIFKIIIIGDSGVGKTNLLAREEGSSSIDRNKTTVGVEFASRTYETNDGVRIKAQIWDTAGQERYRAITTSHYRRAAGALLVYDVTNRKSFDNACEVWFPEFLKSTEDQGTMLQCVSVVGNKIGMTRANVETMGPLLIGINAGIRFGTPNTDSLP